MTFMQTTEALVHLLTEVLEDVPKVLRGNKTVAQRIRTGTVEIAKIAKVWRRESLDQERKKLKKRRKKPR